MSSMETRWWIPLIGSFYIHYEKRDGHAIVAKWSLRRSQQRIECAQPISAGRVEREHRQAARQIHVEGYPAAGGPRFQGKIKGKPEDLMDP